MRKLIIVGASIHQLHLVRKAREMDLETHVFAWEEGAVAKNVADYFYPISIIDKEKILEYAEKINPDGICTIGSDLAISTVSFIASKLNLVSNSEDTVYFSTNKYAMRKKLKESKLPVPKFKKISKKSELDGISYPIMVKTVDRSGSRGISLVYNDQEFDEAFENSINVSFENYILIEEYFEGVQFSVETFSQNSKHHFIGLTEEFYTGPPYFVEEKHIMPGRLSAQLFSEMLSITYKSLDALGITNGAAHSEIRVNEKGDFQIIEIASRMGGDFRYKLIELSNGLDFIAMVIKNALGEQIEMIEPSKSRGALIKYILTKKDYNDYLNLKKNIEIVQSEMLLENFKDNIQDSSHRYGYYIIESDTSQNCLYLLDKYKENL